MTQDHLAVAQEQARAEQRIKGYRAWADMHYPIGPGWNSQTDLLLRRAWMDARSPAVDVAPCVTNPKGTCQQPDLCSREGCLAAGATGPAEAQRELAQHFATSPAYSVEGALQRLLMTHVAPDACLECNGAGEFESALHCEKCHVCGGTGKRTDTC